MGNEDKFLLGQNNFLDASIQRAFTKIIKMHIMEKVSMDFQRCWPAMFHKILKYPRIKHTLMKSTSITYRGVS